MMSKTVLLLILANIVSSLAIDVHLPFSNEIVREFSTSIQAVQWMLALSVALTTMTPLFWGGLSDRVGRRTLFIPACFLMVLGHVACALSSTMTMLVIGRFFQCLGAGSFITVSMAIVCDLCDGAKRARTLAILEMTLPLGMMIAPVLGAELSEWLGFRSCYVILAVMQLLLAISFIFYLPETLKEPAIKQDHSIFQDIKRIGLNKIFFIYSSLRAVVNASYMIFIAYGPFILMNIMGLTMREFGLFQAILPLVYMAGLMATRPILQRYTHYTLLKLGMVGFAIFGVHTMLLLCGVIPTNLYTIMGGFVFSSFISGPILLSCMAIVLADTEANNGIKSGLLELYLGLFSSTFVYLSGFRWFKEITTVYVWSIGCVMLTYVIWFIAKRWSVKTSYDHMDIGQTHPFTKDKLHEEGSSQHSKLNVK